MNNTEDNRDIEEKRHHDVRYGLTALYEELNCASYG